MDMWIARFCPDNGTDDIVRCHGTALLAVRWARLQVGTLSVQRVDTEGHQIVAEGERGTCYVSKIEVDDADIARIEEYKQVIEIYRSIMKEVVDSIPVPTDRNGWRAWHRCAFAVREAKKP